MDKAALRANQCPTPWQRNVAEKRKLSVHVTRNGCCVSTPDSRLYVSLKSVKFKLEWCLAFIHQLIKDFLCKGWRSFRSAQFQCEQLLGRSETKQNRVECNISGALRKFGYVAFFAWLYFCAVTFFNSFMERGFPALRWFYLDASSICRQ